MEEAYLAAFPADEKALGGWAALVTLFFFNPSPNPFPDDDDERVTAEEDVADARHCTLPRARPARAPLELNRASNLPRHDGAWTKAGRLHSRAGETAKSEGVGGLPITRRHHYSAGEHTL
jgi:hypothetical protein